MRANISVRASIVGGGGFVVVVGVDAGRGQGTSKWKE